MTKKHPRSYWWVVLWDEYHIIQISRLGNSFYMAGDNRCFNNDYVKKWIKEVTNPILKDVMAEPARSNEDKCKCDSSQDYHFSRIEPMGYYCNICHKEV